jgi:hypothetical protein
MANYRLSQGVSNEHYYQKHKVEILCKQRIRYWKRKLKMNKKKLEAIKNEKS